MKSFKSLLVLGAMAMASSMAWAQEVIAYTQDFVDAATIKTATASETWYKTHKKGGVYDFSGSKFIGGAANDAVDAAFKSNKIVTVAAWVYGVPGTDGCIFCNGDQNTGWKFMMTGKTFKATSKGKWDYGTSAATTQIADNQWNLIAFAVPGAASTNTNVRYYASATDGQQWTKNEVTSARKMATPANNKCAIGNGNQGDARETYNGTIGDLVVITSDNLLTNSQIANLIGAAPSTEPYVEVGPSAEEIQALQEKIDALTPVIGKVGYPGWEASVTTALLPYNSNFGEVNAENYETAEAALEAYYNSADVVLPEADKYYEIKASYHDGTYQYLGFDGTKLSITDAKPVGGSVTFKAESVDGNNVVLSIDGHYVHWTSGDDKSKTADTDGLNEELDANLNTLVLSKATPGVAGNTSFATPERLFGLLQIQGKSSGSSNKNNLFYFVTRNDLAGVGAFIAGNANDKYYYDNWDHSGHNNTTYFQFVEVEAPSVDVPATAAEIASAADLLWRATAGFMGYPKADDPVVAALDAAVNKAGVTATELGAAVLAYKNCENVVLPEKNQFYQLQGSSTLTVIGGGTTGNAVKLDAEKFIQAPQEVDLSSIYYYSEEGYLINYNGGRALKGSAVAGVSETPDVYTFCHEALTEPGTLSIKNAAGKYLIDVHHNLNTTDAPVGAATNWNVNAYGYAPIVVGSTGYATAYLPYNLVSAPEYGIEAVYVVYEDGDVLQAEEIGCIPARVPVIVKTNGEQRCFGKGMGGSDTWEPSAEVQASLAKNVLSGSLLAIAKPSEALVLGYEDNQIGFYGFTGNVLAGFKAYYQPAAASNGLRIRFDDTLTAIESAVETAQGHQIFDLQGRRVMKAQNGLFIQNGKKVIK